jgi:putative aldouronate transport system substrate-binding protein
MKRLVLLLALAIFAAAVATEVFAGAEPEKAATGPTKIKYWWDMPADKAVQIYKNMGESEIYKYLQQKFNMQIEFLHPPVGQGRDQFNLIVASRDLPDVMEFDLRGLYPGGAAKAIADGVVVKHNDIIAKYAPNLTALYKAHPDWERLAKLDDGSLYGFPFIRGNEGLMSYRGPQYRKDWLDELGLKVPTTIDEFYNVVKAFKDKKKIEYPVSFREKGVGQDGDDLFDNSSLSGAWGVTRGFFLDENKQIKYGNIEPGFKDFLITMNKWFKEGLIDPDFPVQDLKTWRAKIMDGKVGAYFNLVGGGMGFFYDNVKPKNPTFALVGGPYLTLKAGQKSRFGQKDWDVPTPSKAFITPLNKSVPQTAAFLDYGYGKEGDLVFNFGFAGVSYNMVNGYPKYTEAVTKDPNLPMSIAMSKWMRSHYDGPMVQRIEYFEQFMKYPDQVAAAKTWAASSDFSYRMPPVTATAEESSKIAAIMNEVNVYTDEMFVKFFMGQAGFDQWDAYVAQVKKLRIDEALAIQKAALERFNKR